MPSWGQLKGTFTGNAVSIGTSIAASTLAFGSGAVVAGDLVFVVVGEQTTATNTSVTDNLGNTYNPVHAAVDTGTATGRPYFSLVTNPGTITSVTVTANGGSQNGAVAVAIYSGPFKASPLDKFPTAVSDNTSPFTAPTTGTLSQIYELAVSWCVSTGNATFSATAPNTKAVEIATASVLSVRIGHQTVDDTSALTPAWTGTNPTDGMAGVATFMVPIDDPRPGGSKLLKGASIAAALATAWIAAPDLPTLKNKFSAALFEAAAPDPDQAPALGSPRFVEAPDDPLPTLRRKSDPTIFEAPPPPTVDAPPGVGAPIFVAIPDWVHEANYRRRMLPQAGAAAPVDDPPFRRLRFHTWTHDAPTITDISGGGLIVDADRPIYRRYLDLTAFIPPPPMPTLRTKIAAAIYQAPAQVDNPPGKRHRIIVDDWWNETPPLQAAVRKLTPPSVDNPPRLRRQPITNAVDQGAVPTLPRKIAATLTTPIAQVDNPPFGRKRVFHTWTYDGGTTVDVSGGGLIVDADRAPYRRYLDFTHWLPTPPAPTLRSKLNPAILDNTVAVVDQPPGLAGVRIVPQPDQPLPTLGPRKIAAFAGTVVVTDYPRRRPLLDAAFWNDPQPLPTLRRKLTPPSIDNPPPRRRHVAHVYEAPALPTLRPKLPPQITAVPVNDPPGRRASAPLQHWLELDQQIARRKLVAAIAAVVAAPDAVPFKRRTDLSAWWQDDAPVQLRRRLLPPQITAVAADSIPAKRRPDIGAWFEEPAQATRQRKLPPQITAVRVDNPVGVRRPDIREWWLADVQPAVRRKSLVIGAAQAVDNPPPLKRALPLEWWQIEQPGPVVSRKLPAAVTGVQADNPPPPRRPDLSAWHAPVPPIEQRQALAVPPSVDNPPRLRRYDLSVWFAPDFTRATVAAKIAGHTQQDSPPPKQRRDVTHSAWSVDAAAWPVQIRPIAAISDAATPVNDPPPRKPISHDFATAWLPPPPLPTLRGFLMRRRREGSTDQPRGALLI
jgi:hypothetical protein